MHRPNTMQQPERQCHTRRLEEACLERSQLLDAVPGLEGDIVQAELLETVDGCQLDQVLCLQREVPQVKSADLQHLRLIKPFVVPWPVAHRPRHLTLYATLSAAVGCLQWEM